MITKNSLIQARESSNPALLQLRQEYRSNGDKIFFVVEGRDDKLFYTIMIKNILESSNVVFVVANKRKNVVDTYQKADWSYYSKKKVLFMVDRDLSHIIKDNTPKDSNIFMTDYYSIENYFYCHEIILSALEFFYNIDDITEEEKEEIKSLFDMLSKEFENFFLPIMARITFWLDYGISCDLNSIDFSSFFSISKDQLKVKDIVNSSDKLDKIMHDKTKKLRLDYDENYYSTLLRTNDDFSHNIRGKFVILFMLKFIVWLGDNFQNLFARSKKVKSSTNFNEDNLIKLLSGYLPIPDSLNIFLRNLKNSID